MLRKKKKTKLEELQDTADKLGLKVSDNKGKYYVVTNWGNFIFGECENLEKLEEWLEQFRIATDSWERIKKAKGDAIDRGIRELQELKDHNYSFD